MSLTSRTKRAATAALAAALALLVAGAPAGVTAQIAPDGPNLGPPAANLRELIDRYRAWRGPAYDQLQSVHERAYFESAAGRRSGQVWMDRDGRLRIESEGADGKEVQAATPQGAWRASAAGKAATDDPGAAEAARRYAALEFGQALTGRAGAEVALAGTADEDDHTWSVVRVTFGDADTYDALIDPVMGALCCYRITEKGVTREVQFGNWRLVDGVRMPFTQLTRRGADAAGVRLASVEINPPLDAALFEKPAS
jgi:hypothetical protein